MNDSVDNFFEREREAVPLLAPPSGRFEQLQHGARRRRNRNTTAVSMAAAVVVAVVGTGGVLATQGRGTPNTVANPAASTLGTTPSAAAPTTTAEATVPVPQGFQGWSVSFVRDGQQGYAVGGYPCSEGTCVAVLETSDAMASWHTIARPAAAAAYGMASDNAIIRFTGKGLNGWMVASQGVWSTHDSGRTWHAVAALSGRHIDALEAWGSYTYAVGSGSDSLWVTNNPADDASWTEHTRVGLPSGKAAQDSLSVENRMVAVTRRTASSSTVQLSLDNGTGWQPVASPCSGHGAAAQVFDLVDYNHGRFVCADGSLFGVHFDGTPVSFGARFPLASGSGTAVAAHGMSTNDIGTSVAYSGAGIWDFRPDGTIRQTLAGDVGYVGLTNDKQGIALPAGGGSSYWVTMTGGLTWLERSWN